MAMIRQLAEIESLASRVMNAAGHSAIAAQVSADCAWLEACGYSGLKMISEALADVPHTETLKPDAMGLDTRNISCVFIAPEIETLRAERGRIFLRNVRHGLYLVPNSVRGNYGIGCPIDPGFALGGERTKNPYAEKLEAAERHGIEIDDALWQSLMARSQ